jgi:hypothetical protein
MKVSLSIVLLSFYASSATANGDIRGFIPKDENALLTSSSGHQEHSLLDHVDDPQHTETDASYGGFYPGEKRASVRQTNLAEYGEQRKLDHGTCEHWDNDLNPDGTNAIFAVEVVDDFTLTSEQALVSFKFTTADRGSGPGTVLRTYIYRGTTRNCKEKIHLRWCNQPEYRIFHDISETSFLRRDLGQIFFKLHAFEYSVVFSTPVLLGPGTYWIGFQFPEAISGSSLWMTSSGNGDVGHGYYRSSTSGSWYNFGYPLAFEVEVGFGCINKPPVAKCNKDIVTPIGATFSIDNESSDPDGNDMITLEQSDDIFDNPGVYHVDLIVRDNHEAEDTCSATVVAYDSKVGFVTGGGWIATSDGKANFGFVCKYKEGASVPTGEVKFVYDAVDFNFNSELYEWLLYNEDGSEAQVKGSGTFNGENGYMFMLWATDNDDPEQDEFRIRIWLDGNDDSPIYDNGPGQAIDGGSIKIRTEGGRIRS